MNEKKGHILKFFKIYGPVLFLYLLFSIIFTYPLIFKMRTGLYGPFFNTDIRGAVWTLWWTKYAFLHHLNYNLCPFVCAPCGLDLTNHVTFWITFGFSRGMLLLASPILFLNIATLIGFILSGILTYSLVSRLTQSTIAGIISGFIFAFSPYHLNKIMEFTFNFYGTWFVLFVITLLNLKENLCLKNVLLAAVAYAVLLDVNAYYGVGGAIFTLGLLIFCFSFSWKKKFVLLLKPNKSIEIKQKIFHGLRLPLALASLFVLAFLIELPSLIPLIKKLIFMETTLIQKESIGLLRSFNYLFAQSARPLSYLLPASTHPFFGPLTKKMFGSIFYGRGSIEQTLYLGWIPLILAYAAFRRWKYKRSYVNQYPDYLSSKDNFYIGFFIFSAWLAFFFSMPPYVDLGIFKFYFPSFFIYKILPMFRAYARFGMIVMFCVSILAALMRATSSGGETVSASVVAKLRSRRSPNDCP